MSRFHPDRVDVVFMTAGVLLVGVSFFALYGLSRAMDAQTRTDAYCASIGGFTLQAEWPGTNLCVVNGEVVVAP